ncbi:MAG: hypothetical protein B6D79_13745 [gamma proteobacterium symbiont of Ctena orbiculata]|nr:MAG: hypothetical protein B6D79_13745 [gamma proteobacterium symbiont of Ctena orbiculata]
MPTSLKITLITLLCWIHPAQAFFCFSFGGHGKSKGHLTQRQHYFPPPPLLFAPPIANHSQLQKPQALPPIAPAKEQPVIIQGYRFRPVQQEHEPDQLMPGTLRQK